MVFKIFNHIYSDLLDNLEKGNRAVLVTVLKDTGSAKKEILDKHLISDEDIESGPIPKTLESISENIQDSFHLGTPSTLVLKDKKFIVEPFFPKPRVVIFGGGHIAQPLVELASAAEFSVTVVDDRPMFANTARFPRADRVICESFEKSFEKVALKKNDFIVIVTRGHKHDNACLKNALKVQNLSYLGMIGSKKRVRDMIDDFKAEGYQEEMFSQLNAPIGLDIGGVTPFEIAVSIVAQLIEYRRKKSCMAKSLPKKFNWPEFDRDVISALASDETDGKALVTVTLTKGSVPRKAGAKMIVYPDGRILGSIGGGCSEAGIIGLARDLIEEKGYLEERIDMTNQEAEENGMACGGIMDVIVEAF